jgi:hypothetical protein
MEAMAEKISDDSFVEILDASTVATTYATIKVRIRPSPSLSSLRTGSCTNTFLIDLDRTFTPKPPPSAPSTSPPPLPSPPPAPSPPPCTPSSVTSTPSSLPTDRPSPMTFPSRSRSLTRASRLRAGRERRTPSRSLLAYVLFSISFLGKRGRWSDSNFLGFSSNSRKVSRLTGSRPSSASLLPPAAA